MSILAAIAGIEAAIKAVERIDDMIQVGLSAKRNVTAQLKLVSEIIKTSKDAGRDELTPAEMNQVRALDDLSRNLLQKRLDK